MQQNSIQRILVCGAGTMGSGIAETAARAGFETILYDPAAAALTRAKEAITSNLTQLVSKEKITVEEKTATLARLQFHNQIEACKADLVIEAIVEKTDVKQALFAQLAALNGPHTILASNTSSLSLTEIAADVDHKERVCGLHFFNPAQVMKLVELVYTPWTSETVLQSATEVVERMGKTAVVCKDAPGFIVNRVARHFYLEPLRIAALGTMDYALLDQVMENAGFRMGPFKLMDLIGNDINLAVTKSLYEAFGKPERFRPSPLQEEKVAKGTLGRKTGEGYFTY
ncbi:MAG: 3-hydroxybutyryl-CoA dehydrogenase [Sphingobacteriales bacterium]|nr:MAG: 3-hydroxybutyryl-CoA dehydrogenase [Sphingobacteriales bacterium]